MNAVATVIIVGGGLSGLASLHSLLTLIASSPSHPPTHITLLEASPSFGGRLQNSCSGIDLGAAWTWGNDRNLHKLAKQLDVGIVEQPWVGLIPAINNDNSISKHQARQGEVACGDGGFRFVGGSHALISNLLRDINILAAADPRVTLTMSANAACSSLASSGAASTALTATTSSTSSETNEQIAATAAILAMPTYAIANAVAFEPALPASTKSQMLQTSTWMYGMGKATVTFDKPIWRTQGFAGTATGGGCFDITWDNSYNDTYAIAGFLSNGDGGDDEQAGFFAQKRTLEERILDNMEAWYGPEGKSGVVATKTWNGESLYGHEGHERSARSHDYGRFKKHPLVDNIIFAGTESEGEHGHMEGAVIAGLRAAKEVFKITSKLS